MSRKYSDDAAWYDSDGDAYPFRDPEEYYFGEESSDILPKGWKIPSLYREDILDERSDDEDEEVTFIRPDGSPESKTIGWCKDNGFSQVGEGLWAGPWYWQGLGDEPEEDKWEESGLPKRKDEETPEEETEDFEPERRAMAKWLGQELGARKNDTCDYDIESSSP
jgi:hypothetical protein